MADMSITKAREIVENPSEYTKQQVRNAKQKVADPAASVQLNAGGDVAKKKKEVPKKKTFCLVKKKGRQ